MHGLMREGRQEPVLYTTQFPCFLLRRLLILIFILVSDRSDKPIDQHCGNEGCCKNPEVQTCEPRSNAC